MNKETTTEKPPVEKTTETTPPPPPKEKTILPDWQKLIDDLRAQIDDLTKEKEEGKAKVLELATAMEDLKKSAPPKIQQKIEAIFSPWDMWGFGEKKTTKAH